MRIEVNIPEELAGELCAKSRDQQMSVEVYTTELLTQLLALQALGSDAELENRPDWQAALERSRADLRAGRVVPHQAVEDWHESHSGSSGLKKP